ncbi:hypothetical protein HHI36_000524 [Cryptolaemus montrouzieri]|uniref:Peptidase S1 domain-containing protein n=1 Tax=Cryptolaemus montrouzieri TaxID=559131 RepID=A0ABD2P5Z0_9CUCU
MSCEVPVATHFDCKSLYSYADIELSEEQLCAGGEKEKDSCKGDSGGALMTVGVDQRGNVNWYSAAVVSFGPDPCGSVGWPGVYTRTSKYMDWILTNMKP